MKKIIAFFISFFLLLFQFLYAQTLNSAQFVKNKKPGIGKEQSPYYQLLIVNGKPARVSATADQNHFSSLMILNGYQTINHKNVIPESIKSPSPFGMGTITTSVGITSACIGSGFTIDYSTTNATFSVGNVFTAQLSDSAGTFSSPVNIGTLVSTATLGTISVTIPSNTIPGSNYKIRVVSNDPIITGSSSSSLTLSSTNTWTGAVSSAWEDPANWSCGLVPNENTDVIINSGTVIVNSNAFCKSLSVNPGVSFTVNTGFVITVVQ